MILNFSGAAPAAARGRRRRAARRARVDRQRTAGHTRSRARRASSFLEQRDTGPFDAVARFPGGSGRRAPPVLDVPARPDRRGGDAKCVLRLALGGRLVLDGIPKRAVSRVWRAPSIFFWHLS